MKGFQLLVITGIVVGVGTAGCASAPDRRTPSIAPAMACGQADIALAFDDDGDRLALTHQNRVLELQRVASASGARYQSSENPDTWLWSRGQEATLTLDGLTYPTCLAAGAVPKPFYASGNEPFWQVIVEPGQIVLERPNEPTAEILYETVSRSPSGRTFRAQQAGLSVELVTAPQLCRDSMSGMPHPYQVRLSINGKPLSGCGGEPARLLMGDPWVVEDIGGQGIVDRSRVTVQFLPEGKVLGTGSCNRYTGSWTLDGEAIAVSGLASTRKACPPALMNQEDRFLNLLASVTRFDLDA